MFIKSFNSMEQTPSSEFKKTSVKKIPYILWNPKVNFCVRMWLPLVCLINQKYPVPTLPCHFF